MLLRSLFQKSADRSVNEIHDLLDAMGQQTSSGARVTEGNAIKQATVYSCVRILSESIGSLPIGLYRKDGKARIEVEDHASLRVLQQPNSWMTAHEFWALMVLYSELRGNAYAYKVRNGRGEVSELLPLQSSQVEPRIRDDWQIEYRVTTTEANPVRGGVYGQDRIMHLRNMSADGLCGLSTIRLHAEEIGAAQQMQKHGAILFKNGAQIGKYVEHPGKLSDEAWDRLKKSLKKEWEGVENAHKTIILEEGMKVSSIAMTSEDAQFIESRKFSKQEIASIFGVPLFLLNETEKSTTWGTGLEQISKAFVRYTLRPRLSRIEQTLRREFLAGPDRRNHEYAFTTDDFTLADFKTRMEGYAKGIEAGVINPDEARATERMNPRPGGDQYRQPANMQTEGEDSEPEEPPMEEPPDDAPTD